jgi:hypothetical protein
MIPKRDISDRMLRPSQVVRRNARGLFLSGCMRRGCAIAAQAASGAPQASAKLRETPPAQSGDAENPENPDTYAK